MTLYGIANCGTVKKARAWLDERGIDYVFHDYKRAGLDEATLRSWVAELGWEQLLNKRGQMWRKLPPAVRDDLDEASALQVMLQTPTIIRRPVLDIGGSRHVGFTEDQYQALFAS